MKAAYSYDAIVVGTGAAGYSAACRIRQLGNNSVVIVTEGVSMGTSRNTGSDKQTYYKLGLGGSAPDSVRAMAQDLFDGGCTDGDNALCEAALSARCFSHLCELGVPFPANRYGEYVGYRTDHDPRARATSAGPLTSRFMTQALEAQAKKLGIPVYNRLLAVEILKSENKVCGLLCLDQDSGNPVLFRTGNVVLATGGPAGIYADSVYPLGHTGSTGLALSAGASLQNMTEWQFGLASIAPRWNVSGSYMQVLPRMYSLDEQGNEHEFLEDFFPSPAKALSCLFLKGYQWPFDSGKVLEGSSVIDLLVYQETVLKHRRVFLDYRKNPFGGSEIDFSALAPEARSYLQKAGVCFGTPIIRLLKMNAPAVELYWDKGVDLKKEPLEIALCAQHNNGGIAVNLWWQTDVPGLFAAGECAGTHGVRRPGGSALNAGQVGSLRAAQYISARGNSLPEAGAFGRAAQAALDSFRQRNACWLANEDNVEARIQNARRRMSDLAGPIREPEAMRAALAETEADLQALDTLGVASREKLVLGWKLRDLLLTQQAMLTACLNYAEIVGESRGSALYPDPGGSLRAGLDPRFRFRPGGKAAEARIQQVRLENGEMKISWRDVRPIPEDGDFFETVWADFRKNQNIY